MQVHVRNTFFSMVKKLAVVLYIDFQMFRYLQLYLGDGVHCLKETPSDILVNLYLNRYLGYGGDKQGLYIRVATSKQIIP